MSSVLSWDGDSAVVSAQAGVTLQSLQEYLHPMRYSMPWDLAARGSCQLGGNIATNAGGVSFVRHGPLHGSLRGVQFVDGTGALVDVMNTHAKDNTGLHLKNLMVGSEGTLGIITAAAVQAAPLAACQRTVLLATNEFDDIVRLMRRARRSSGGALAAFEYFDATSLATVLRHSSGAADPIPEPFAYYALVQFEGGQDGPLTDVTDAFLMESMAAGEYVEGVVASSVAQQTAMWRLREDIATAASARGLVFKYDVSLSASDMQRLVSTTTARLKAAASASLLSGACIVSIPAHRTYGEGVHLGDQGVSAMGYGHVADGNLHLNVTVPWSLATGVDGGRSALATAVEACLEPWVYDQVLSMGGSISAEHGMGQAKAAWLVRCKGGAAVAAMRRIKAAMDPQGIMNPGKVLPPG
jgi:D-2-hydroxyglutarate dehydrogenase